jgi:hypothetical protein
MKTAWMLSAGAELDKVFKKHLFFVALAVFSAGVLAARLIPSAPGASDSDGTANERRRVEPPARTNVAAFGPITGDLRRYGLRQVRGLLAGIMHVVEVDLGSNCQKWMDHFTLTIEDETRLWKQGAQLRSRLESLAASNDVTFGPMASDNVEMALMHEQLLPENHVILTAAAIPGIRRHPSYADKILQLSPNMTDYLEQLVSYFFDYSASAPTDVLCITTNSLRMGSIGAKELQLALARRNLAAPLIWEHSMCRDSAATTDCDELVDLLRDDRWKASTSLIVVIAVSDELTHIADAVQRSGSEALCVTPNAIEKEEIGRNCFDGFHFMYSYPLTIYSLDVARFQRNCKLAEVYMRDSLGLSWTVADMSNEVGSVDAETHDAFLYWWRRLRCESSELDSRDYVGGFSVSGSGEEFGNHGCLYMFEVQNSSAVPAGMR